TGAEDMVGPGRVSNVREAEKITAPRRPTMAKAKKPHGQARPCATSRPPSMGPEIAPRRPTPADRPMAEARTEAGWFSPTKPQINTWEEKTKIAVKKIMTYNAISGSLTASRARKTAEAINHTKLVLRGETWSAILPEISNPTTAPILSTIKKASELPRL